MNTKPAIDTEVIYTPSKFQFLGAFNLNGEFLLCSKIYRVNAVMTVMLAVLKISFMLDLIEQWLPKKRAELKQFGGLAIKFPLGNIKVQMDGCRAK